jgi:hypothetical protein
MSYPTPSDYQEAVQDPASAFADAELQSATPRENVLGLPQPITGAFAAVFPMTTETGVRYAAKCFLSEVPQQQRRYAAVSAYLSEGSLGWTVPFDYQREGISVHGTAYPLLKMQWARGDGLNRFVEKHLGEPGVLRALADQWVTMCADLEAAEVAHGDLQHGNIRVERSDDGLALRLVDYDTMYVPALAGGTSAEVGHRNYQHPDRTEDDFGPALDRFSALAIYTGLRACAERPELWQAYDSGENLLFRDGDFYDPDASPLFRDVREVDELRPFAEALRTACYVEPASVPPLTEVVDGEDAFEGVSIRGPRRDRSQRLAVRRDAFEWAWSPGMFAAGVASAALGAWTAPVFGAMAAVASAVAALAAAGFRYRQQPAVRRDRRLARESDRISRLIQNIRRQITSLEQKREEVLASVDEQRAERLQEIREEVIYNHLKHHFIGELRDVEGLTHKHVVRLKSANIRTAYEATRSRIGDLRRMSDKTQARIAMWRATLLREAEDEMPEELSPAEERRLRRYVEHRVSDIDAEIRRAREKIEVQSTEREEIEDRREELPGLSLGRYIASLLFIGSRPARKESPPAPASPQSNVGAENANARPEPAVSDGPWWEKPG